MANAQYWLRIVHCPRVIIRRAETNEGIEDWPEGKSYTAKPLALNAGEEIRQGVKESSDFLKLEIQGHPAIEAVDRIKIKSSGRVYRLTAQPIRERRTTVLTAESV